MKVNSKSRGFVEGTLVLMADGSQKPIEQIKTGDIVLSFDEFDSNAPLEPMSVTNTFSRIDNNILEVKTSEGILKVAKDQMFIGPHNDWKEVYNHSLVVDVDGNPIEYTVNKVNKGKHRVYDITVDENHSLIANGIRVHNAISQGSKAQASASSVAKSTTNAARNSPMGGQGSSFGGNPQQASNYNKGVTGSLKAGNNPSGSKKASNTTPKGTVGTNPNSGGGGKSQTQSANSSLGSRNNSGADRRGGGNSGTLSFGNSIAKQKVSNGAGGYRKKSSASNDESVVSKPSGVSVSTKLVETIADTIDVLQELVTTLEPTQLTATKITIQSGVDSIYTFANSFNATLYASEMSVYDKTELIQMNTTIMNTAAELRNPFEETFVTAAGKKLATILLSVLETEINRCKSKLGMYVTTDTKGGLTVSVDGRETNQETEEIQIRRGTRTYTKTYYPKVKRASNGRYTSATTRYGYRVRPQ